MNTTAFGFRQDIAKEHGVKLTELLFLDWFAYWYGSDKMCTVIHDGKMYGWIDRKYVIRQLPLLEINHVDSVTRLITRMIDKGLLERHVRANEDNRGHRLFIKPGPLMHTLRGGDDVDNCDPPPREGEESDDQPTVESVSQPDQPTVESAKTPGPADPTVCSYTNPRDNTNPNIYTPDSVSQKPSRKPRKPRVPDLTLGCEENVRLTTPEYERLVAEHSEDIINAAIDELSMWKAERGKRVKRDDLALRRWAINAAYERREKQGVTNKRRAGDPIPDVEESWMQYAGI